MMEMLPCRESLTPSRPTYKEGGWVGIFSRQSSRATSVVGESTIVIAMMLVLEFELQVPCVGYGKHVGVFDEYQKRYT